MATSVPKAIKAAAKRKNVPLEHLRREAAVSGDYFYSLLRGEEPRTLPGLQKLANAGVRFTLGMLGLGQRKEAV